MKRLLIALLSLVGSFASAETANLTVTLGPNQYVKGINTESAQAFLGLRYAQPPTGDRRFRPTVYPEDRWTGTWDGSKTKPMCPQIVQAQDGTSSYQGQEDCLTINIFRPKTVGSGRPVLFWIHGGGFFSGSGHMPGTEGSNFAKLGNMIVVTFNYRLGRLGFLSHPLLTKRLGHPSGNFGFYDQIAALQWVKKNISAFGGDPNQVTIMGVSAGGASVMQMITSPKAAGLFQRAIVESTFVEMKTQEYGERLGKQVEKDVLCESTSEEQVLWCLMNTAPDHYVRKQSKSGLLFAHEYRYLSGNGGPVLDGIMFTKSAVEAAKTGQINGNQFIVGTNSGDGVLGIAMYFGGNSSLYTVNEFKNSLVRAYGSTKGSQLAQIYDPMKFQTTGDAVMAHRNDFDMACSSRQFVRALKASGKSVRRYVFDGMFFGGLQNLMALMLKSGSMPMSLPIDLTAFSVPFPAFHGLNGAYEFQNVQMIYDKMAAESGQSMEMVPMDKQLQAMSGGYWTSFVKSGVPSAAGQPAWAEYDANLDNAQMLRSPAVAKNGPNKAGCDVYDSIYPSDARMGY